MAIHILERGKEVNYVTFYVFYTTSYGGSIKNTCQAVKSKSVCTIFCRFCQKNCPEGSFCFYYLLLYGICSV